MNTHLHGVQGALGAIEQAHLRRMVVAHLPTQGDPRPVDQAALGKGAVTGSRTDSNPLERYGRVARLRGKRKTIVALGRSTRVIAWHLSADHEAGFIDLGSGFYDGGVSPARKTTPTPGNFEP